jgi:hypothetical protein
MGGLSSPFKFSDRLLDKIKNVIPKLYLLADFSERILGLLQTGEIPSGNTLKKSGLACR